MFENPLQTMVHDAEVLYRGLGEACRNLELAIEAKALAETKFKAAEQAHKDAEAEFVAELMFEATGPMAKAKNAEQREVVKDAALVESRTSGFLAPTWAQLNRARTESVNAQMNFDICETRFRGARIASELRSAMLLTYAKG